MPIVPHRPFWDLDRWFGEDWPRTPMMRAPRMDIYEDNGNVVAEAELPGVEPKNIEVEVKDNILKVEAKAEKKKEEKGKGYFRREMSQGYFRRAVPLPVEVLGEKAQASYQDGVLKVVIPKTKPKKKEEGKKVKIKVKTKTA